MLSPAIYGILYGMIFLFGFGPAFFALFQISLEEGVKRAMIFVMGIACSDWIFVTLTLYGFGSLTQSESIQFWMSAVGVVVLLVFGYVSWTKNVEKVTVKREGEKKWLIGYFVKGLLLNGLNPFIILTWATWVSVVKINYQYGTDELIQFFIAMLATILTLDILKAVLAARLKHLIKPRFLLIMNRTIAVIVVGFAIRIVVFLVGQ